jgi:putative ABC transport system ATP-binding protein
MNGTHPGIESAGAAGSVARSALEQTADQQLAVETRALTKVYGQGNTEVVAMQDVSLKVRPGEMVALLGPSGSGKSTFLTAVGLINLPTAGQVFIRGQWVSDGPHPRTDLVAYRRRQIGIEFQKSN